MSVWWLNELEGKKWELLKERVTKRLVGLSPQLKASWRTLDRSTCHSWSSRCISQKNNGRRTQPETSPLNDEKEPGLKIILYLLGRVWQGHSRNFFGAVSNNQLHFWHFSLVGSLSNLWGPGVLPTHRVSCADNILPFGRRFPVGYKAPKQKHTHTHRTSFLHFFVPPRFDPGFVESSPPSPWLITRQVIQAGRRTQAREILTNKDHEGVGSRMLGIHTFSANVKPIFEPNHEAPHEKTSIFFTIFRLRKGECLRSLGCFTSVLTGALGIPGIHVERLKIWWQSIAHGKVALQYGWSG